MSTLPREALDFIESLRATLEGALDETPGNGTVSRTLGVLDAVAGGASLSSACETLQRIEEDGAK